MTPRTTTAAAPVAGSGQDPARAFRLTINPDKDDSYGVTVEETYGENGHTLATHVITATPTQAARITDAVLAAARGSGHHASVVAFNRKAPIRVHEPDGVRLTLILLATQPITKHSRVRAVVAGVNSMSIEETYYWYAKCIGPASSRSRKALRTLLADD